MVITVVMKQSYHKEVHTLKDVTNALYQIGRVKSGADNVAAWGD